MQIVVSDASESKMQRQRLLLLVKMKFLFFRFEYSLQLPHLPDMVFPKNILTVTFKNAYRLEFNALDALKCVESCKNGPQVACAEEWQESRPQSLLSEKVKPFDWTFSTDYQGTIGDAFVAPTDLKLNIFKLMKKEEILFYHDLTLFEDELHDHGIASCSVKIVSLFKMTAVHRKFNSFFHFRHFLVESHAVGFLYFVKILFEGR